MKPSIKGSLPRSILWKVGWGALGIVASVMPAAWYLSGFSLISAVLTLVVGVPVVLAYRRGSLMAAYSAMVWGAAAFSVLLGLWALYSVLRH